MKPYWSNGRVVLWQGHVLDALAAMEAQSVHCAVTSPPYWGLRDYDLPSLEWPAVSYAPMAGLPPLDIPGCDSGCVHVWGEEVTGSQNRHHVTGDKSTSFHGGQQTEEQLIGSRQIAQGQYCQLCGGWRGCLGLEPTPEAFVGHIVLVARELWRVLRDDGTFWLNFGDSYNNRSISRPSSHQGGLGFESEHLSTSWADLTKQGNTRGSLKGGLKEKDLIGIPWRVAFALQADGWYLRSDIIWAKGVSYCPTYSGSCMPGSQQDRPTTSHEHVFLLSKKARYFYDNEAIRERLMGDGRKRGGYPSPDDPRNGQAVENRIDNPAGRTVRSVWTINPGSYAGAHFATFSPALVRPMILAGSSSKGCCPECGSPWVRVTEKSGAIKNTDYETEQRSAMQQGGKASTTLNGTPAQTTTTGWTPTCSHYDWEHCAVCGEEIDDYDKEHGDHLDCGHNICAECLMAGEAAAHVRECELSPIPCTVLDPFLGSGTTAEVADFLGRHSVGIELSKKYCDEHIIPRLTEPLFEWAAQEQQEPEPEIEQMEMKL